MTLRPDDPLLQGYPPILDVGLLHPTPGEARNASWPAWRAAKYVPPPTRCIDLSDGGIALARAAKLTRHH